MIKVCVLGHTFIGWGGGIDLIKKYINAMLDRNDLQVMLLLPEVANTSDLIFDFSSAYPNLPIKVLSPNDSIVDVLKNEKVNIIFPSHPALGHDFPIPWIGYICDFQHKYYPEFFSREEIAQREALFPHVLNESRAIIVTSRTAKEDIEKYYPKLSFKSAIYVEPFFPTPRKTWFELDNVNIVKYNLPQRYFIISNQFWIHKAHNTAFEALALLHEDSKYKDVKLVCTGKMDDYRDDSHSAKLRKLLEKLNIVEQVMFLGYIPKLEQIKILRNSVSLVQPTLYEGSPGGAAVEDAIAMGKRAIVSDIPVNKEINCGEILFFKAGSAENLKEKMIIALETLENSPSNEFLINRMNDSKIIMGNFIADMCQQVIASYENGSKNFSGVSDENLKEIDEYIGNLQTRLNNMQSKINALEIKEKSTPPPGVRSEKQILKQTFSREPGKCPICGGEARYFDKAVMLKKYDVTYYRCLKCESIFTEDPYWLDEAYDEAITPVDVGLVQRNVDLFPIFRNIIEGMYPKAEKFLDFAGGRGLWVRMMRDNGYDFRWFDKYAEDMFNPPFVDIAKIEDKYDVVTALEVFEHLVCPKEDLKELLEHTENLIFTTQTVPPNLQRVEDWWYFAPLEGQHIMFYTQKALNKLAADFNMCYIGTPLIHIFSKEPISKEAFEACLTGNISVAKRTSLVESDFERAYAIYNAV